MSSTLSYLQTADGATRGTNDAYTSPPNGSEPSVCVLEERRSLRELEKILELHSTPESRRLLHASTKLRSVALQVLQGIKQQFSAIESVEHYIFGRPEDREFFLVALVPPGQRTAEDLLNFEDFIRKRLHELQFDSFSVGVSFVGDGMDA